MTINRLSGEPSAEVLQAEAAHPDWSITVGKNGFMSALLCVRPSSRGTSWYVHVEPQNGGYFVRITKNKALRFVESEWHMSVGGALSNAMALAERWLQVRRNPETWVSRTLRPEDRAILEMATVVRGAAL